jgi:hypothetical protein
MSHNFAMKGLKKKKECILITFVAKPLRRELKQNFSSSRLDLNIDSWPFKEKGNKKELQ